MRRRRAWLTILCAVLVAGVTFAGATALLRGLKSSPSELGALVESATDGHRFGLVRFELTHLPNRLLTEVAAWFGEPEDDDDEILERWFAERDAEDRKAAERVLERLLSEAVEARGVRTPLPLFSGVRLVWPPVDMDIDETLHVLAVSKRDEVQLVRTVLLGSEVSLEDRERIEQTVESSGEWSAWVTRIGGVALYPAPVIGSRHQLGTLQVMAHEWTHHYLGFHKLGLAYAQGSEMRTINETVADIVGDELGQAAAAKSAFQQSAVEDSEWTALLERTDPILRQLRIDVDALLARGEVEAAEQLMVEARDELASMGRSFRRINQAFLAFRGGYGASGSSASPWGPRLFALRERAPSLAEFVESVRGIGSPDEAEAVLPR